MPHRGLEIRVLYRPLLNAVVGAEGSDQRVGSQLLHHVGGPAGDAAGDKNGGERWGVESHEVVRGPAG